jgi:hypothetical protein
MRSKSALECGREAATLRIKVMQNSKLQSGNFAAALQRLRLPEKQCGIEQSAGVLSLLVFSHND